MKGGLSGRTKTGARAGAAVTVVGDHAAVAADYR